MVGIADDAVGTLPSPFDADGVKTAHWRQLVNLENVREIKEFWDWDVAPGALGLPPLVASDFVVVTPTPTILYALHEGFVRDESSGTDTFFEDVHVVPKLLDLGFISQETAIQIEVFNAYRRTPQTLDAWTNNDGPGIDVTGLPTLPHEYERFNGSGYDVFVELTLNGDPLVNTTLDFDWDTVGTDVVKLIFSRLVPLATTRSGLLIPEAHHSEKLAFLTDILEKSTGKEQRIALRKNPRQNFGHTYKVPGEFSGSEVDILIADSQHLSWAVGVWAEEVRVTSQVSAGATVIDVVETAYEDFRVGSAAAIYVEDEYYDMRGIEAITATTITFTTGVDNAYPVGAYVVPIRASRITQAISGARYSRNLSELSISFETKDNDIDIASTAAFNTYNGKVLLDDYNFLRGTSPSGFARRFVVIDNEVGVLQTESPWLMSKLTMQKVFMTKTNRARWEVRQLLHALRGMQISFYLPSFRDDLEVTQSIAKGSDRLRIIYVGYTNHALGNPRWDVIRMTLADGTQYIRQITGSFKITGDAEEELTVDAEWEDAYTGVDIDVDDIERVEFVNLVRFDSDEITFTYERGSRATRIAAPVKLVLE